MYATAADYVQEFGFTETFQLLRDEAELLTVELLREAMAGVFLSGHTDDEIAAATQAVARLADIIVRSERFIDGFIRSAVTLPLTQDQVDQTPLKTCCLELSRCQLKDDDDNMSELQQERCKEARSWLKEVARGNVKLLSSPASTSGRVLSGRMPSAYNWGAFGK
jgi:phage gp36-like protein